MARPQLVLLSIRVRRNHDPPSTMFVHVADDEIHRKADNLKEAYRMT